MEQVPDGSTGSNWFQGFRSTAVPKFLEPWNADRTMPLELLEVLEPWNLGFYDPKRVISGGFVGPAAGLAACPGRGAPGLAAGLLLKIVLAI